jgi:hypothetical protein
MWAALKSDLSEFVSGVAEETDQVIGSATKFSDEGEVLEGGFEATGVVQSPKTKSRDSRSCRNLRGSLRRK